jgi:tetratricopeptide (TPR) repeat protein
MTAGGGGVTAEGYDAFVSYAHADAAWVHALAENLERLGLRVFLDAWELVPGDLIAVKLQDGLARAGAVVFVVSPESVGRGWVDEEFGAAVAGAAAGRQRLIPVLYGEVALPPLVASRLYVDFRQVDDPAVYGVRELAAAVRGTTAASRPAPGGGIVPPPGVYRAEGPRPGRLVITPDEVRFSTAERAVVHRPVGLDARGLAVLGEAERSRARPGQAPLRAAAADGLGGGLHVGLVQAGMVLGRCFLDGAAGEALAGEAAAAAAGGGSLRLAVEVPDPGLARLPWEALVLPGQDVPLVLQDRVQMYRSAALADVPAIQVRGPLRILAVIASPDAGGGQLLDYEAELAAIISAVDPARRGEGAFVQVLNWGSLAAIRDALLGQRFHVLHLSCHARPGELLLEDAAGRADAVDAARFAAEALPAERGVPLIVLAGCSTALPAPGQRNAAAGQQAAAAGDGSPDDLAAAARTAEALEGLATELLHRGIPAAVAMTAPVTDRYATVFAAEVYRQLAMREEPVPLAAVSDARRMLEARRRALPPNDPWSAIAEWATPVLVQAGPPLALFRRADGLERLAALIEPVFAPGMVVRRVGEFVGRRAELRTLLRALRGTDAGVVLHGIGGIGKSTLAAQLADQLGDEAGLVVAVSAAAALTVDLIFEELRTALLAHALEQRLDSEHPLRQVAAALTDASPPWRVRLELIRRVVLPRLPVLLLADNAEDLLTGRPEGWEVADPDLAGFLAAWVQAAPRARLLVTSRYPFTLPGRADRRLAWHHLGPLSLAETRKLTWRLPALDALPASDQQRAHTMVGGHPRTLEYLDALLRGGDAAFPDVAARLETALDQRGIGDPARWLHGVEGDLDRALAETVTLAADDILLDSLLTAVQDAPPARELIGRLAVYRRPVDETGIAWQLSELTTVPDPPGDLLVRIEPVRAALREARRAGTAHSAEDLGLDPETLDRYHRDMAELTRPPVTLTADGRRALGLLAGLGLAAPAAAPETPGHQGTPGWVVHRWTAAALQDRTSRDGLTAAHRRAAAYWRWRVAVWPQSRAEDVEQLLEARYHHHAAGDLDDALAANEEACGQLRIWGAWTTERQLWDEALSWVPPRSRPAAAIRGQLGDLAYLRGDYDTTEQHYQAALIIAEELGDQASRADTYHQLGILAQARGDYDTAEQRYQASLTIFEELGDRASLAHSYGQLGTLALDRGDYDTAEQRYQASLTITEELGNRATNAITYHHLGMLAQARGDYDTAEQRYQAALAIFEELGDRASIASTYHQLGALAQDLGDYDTAEQRYQASLAIAEELGDRAGIADTYHQLGILAQVRGDYDTAEQRYQAALTITEELGDRAGAAATLSQFGSLRTDQGRAADAVGYQVQSLAIRAELGLADAAGRDLRRLREQRTTLGDEQFQHILQTLLDTDGTATIMHLTETD